MLSILQRTRNKMLYIPHHNIWVCWLMLISSLLIAEVHETLGCIMLAISILYTLRKWHKDEIKWLKNKNEKK